MHYTCVAVAQQYKCEVIEAQHKAAAASPSMLKQSVQGTGEDVHATDTAVRHLDDMLNNNCYHTAQNTVQLSAAVLHAMD